MDLIPEIVTERLILRGFRTADFPRFSEIWAQPEVVRWLGMGPRTTEDSWKAFLGIAGNWLLFGTGQWAVADRGSGRIIGQTGFFCGRRGLGADFDAAVECGWVFAPEVWGQGYAREAVGAAHVWFDAQEGVGGRSHAMISIGHRASEAVAAAMGYRVFAKVDIDGALVGLYARAKASSGGVG